MIMLTSSDTRRMNDVQFDEVYLQGLSNILN
jgi:hypothetical protein